MTKAIQPTAPQTQSLAENDSSSCVQDFVKDVAFGALHAFWEVETTLVGRVFSTLTPGEYSQAESKIWEVIIRIGLFCWALPALVLLLPIAITAHLSLACVRIGDIKDFQHRKGNLKPIHGEIKTISHLNTCMLAGSMPKHFGGMDIASHRVEALCNKLKKLNSDLILLSEVNGGIAPAIINRLREQYAHFFFRMGVKPFGNESGLFVACKHACDEMPQFTPFKCQGTGMQSMYKRGYFVLQSKKSYILFTHLHPGTDQSDAHIRQQQLQEIYTLAYQLEADGKQCLIIGDLNIDGFKPVEYQAAITNMGLHEVGNIKNEETCMGDAGSESMDHALVLNKKGAWQAKLEDTYHKPPIPGYSQSLSDHKLLHVYRA